MAPATEAQSQWVARVLGYTAGPRQAAAAPAGARDGAAARREGDVGRLAKGLLLWNETRSHVRQQVTLLHETILSTMEGHPDFGEISAAADRLEAIFDVLDDRLSDKLNALRGTTDQAAKSKLIGEARGVVADYRTYVDGDWLMLNIDTNGFIPLDIHPRVSAALDGVLSIL